MKQFIINYQKKKIGLKIIQNFHKNFQRKIRIYSFLNFNEIFNKLFSHNIFSQDESHISDDILPAKITPSKKKTISRSYRNCNEKSTKL